MHGGKSLGVRAVVLSYAIGAIVTVFAGALGGLRADGFSGPLSARAARTLDDVGWNRLQDDVGWNRADAAVINPA